MAYAPEHLQTMQRLYLQNFGKPCTAEEAEAMLDRLVGLYRILLRGEAGLE